MKFLKVLAATTAVAALLASPAFAQTRIALVVKSLGNGFFDAANTTGNHFDFNFFSSQVN